MDVAIVSTGSANLASVIAALQRLGATPTLTTDPGVVARADRLVLPGVGAFGAAMQSLRAAGLVDPLRRRIEGGGATLCICLGLQLLASGSEESPGVTGLGVVPDVVKRLHGPRVPQMGWNAVTPARGGRYLSAMSAYYANSFALERVPRGWSGAVSHYGGQIVGAIERGRVLACQFHPELSGPAGLALLGRWLRDEPAAGGTHAPPGLATRIIPCLDVRDGRVVKGVKFQNLRDAGDPAQQSAEYERQGADELVMLDVSATPEGRGTAADTVRAIRRVLSIPLTVGGGVRTVDDAARLLDAGADKVGVNTAAVERPELIAELADRFGRQCVVLAIDAARVADFGADRRLHPKARPPGISEASASPLGAEHRDRHGLNGAVFWEVVVQSGKSRTGIDAVAWAERGAELGAGEILLTSYDRDGTGEGYDLELLRQVCGGVHVPVIASGGAKSAEHLAQAVRAGASAVLAATIFHDGHTTVGAVKAEMSRAGIPVRMDARPIASEAAR